MAYNGNGPEATAGSDEQIDRKGTGTNLATMRGCSSYALRSGFTNEQKPREKLATKRFYAPVNGDEKSLSAEDQATTKNDSCWKSTLSSWSIMQPPGMTKSRAWVVRPSKRHRTGCGSNAESNSVNRLMLTQSDVLQIKRFA